MAPAQEERAGSYDRGTAYYDCAYIRRTAIEIAADKRAENVGGTKSKRQEEEKTYPLPAILSSPGQDRLEPSSYKFLGLNPTQ